MPAGIPTSAERRTAVVTYSQDGDHSGYFTLPSWTTFVGVDVPDLTNAGDVGLQRSNDGGSTWIPVGEPINGVDLVVCTSGQDPMSVDLSDFIRAFVPEGTIDPTPTRFRFALGATEDTADKTFYVYVRG